MAQVETLILEGKTVGVDKSAKEMDKLADAADRAGDEIEQTGKQAEKAGRVFKGFRGASSALTNTTGQLSVQVQDVAVQLESGTDAVRVFAQQGPQIAAIFGPSGALFGALLAVGALVAGPFVRSFFAANEAIKEASKSIKEYSGDLTDLTKAERALKLNQITSELRDLKEETKNLEDAQADALGRFNDLRSSGGELFTALGEITSGFTNLGDAQADSAEKLAETNVALEKARERKAELIKQADILTGRTKEETKEIKEQAENLEQLNTQLDGQIAMLGMTIVEKKVYNALQEGANAAEAEQVRIKAKIIQADTDAENALRKLRVEGEQFLSTLEQQADKTNMSRVEILRAKLETVLLNDESRELAETYIDLIEKEEKRKKAIKESAEALREQSKEMAEFRRLVDEEQDIIDKRRKKAEKEAKAEAKREAEKFGELGKAIAEEDKFNRERAEREAEYNQMMADDAIRIADQEAKRKREIQEQYTDGILGLEDKLLKGKSEKQKLGFRALVNLSNAERRLNASGIISDSYAAAMSAWKALAGIPIVGPALGAAAAAGIIAGGVSYAAQSLAGRAVGGQVRQGESYVVGERGPEVLTMGVNSGRVIPNERLVAGRIQDTNKTANVTFNIQAKDARGFDQLLMQRRGMIVSMINSAMNDKGRQAIV